MDPLSIVTSVISTAIAIRDWIDALKAKEKALHELNITVSRIAQILSPLQTPSSTPSLAPSIVDVDPPPYTTSAVATVWMADVSVTSCLQDMADILGHIHEHLEIWNGKRSKYSSLLAFINPSSLLQKFRDDEKLLTQRMNVLSFALQFAAARTPHISITTPPLPSHRPSPLDTVGSSEVKRFWTDKFGTEVSCVSEESFFGALCDWLKLPLDKHTRDVMLLRLDESGVGGVTVRSLDDWVGKQNIRERVSFLDVLQGSTVMHPLSPRPQETGDDTTVRPLILWIDDNPNSVTRLCEHARSQGVTVVAITSTAAAKVWIESNQELVRRADRAQRLRIISDNARWERKEASALLNYRAGEKILRYLRGRMYMAPVLIYCGDTSWTAYVDGYERAGSTADYSVCKMFITALANGSTADNSWEGCGRWYRSSTSINSV